MTDVCIFDNCVQLYSHINVIRQNSTLNSPLYAFFLRFTQYKDEYLITVYDFFPRDIGLLIYEYTDFSYIYFVFTSLLDYKPYIETSDKYSVRFNEYNKSCMVVGTGIRFSNITISNTMVMKYSIVSIHTRYSTFITLNKNSSYIETRGLIFMHNTKENLEKFLIQVKFTKQTNYSKLISHVTEKSLDNTYLLISVYDYDKTKKTSPEMNIQFIHILMLTDFEFNDIIYKTKILKEYYNIMNKTK